MASRSAIWRPNQDPANPQLEKKLAGPCEVTALSLKAGGGSAAVALYDGSDTNAKNGIPIWYLDASTTDNDNQSFDEALIFTKGVYAVCEEGLSGNPIVCIAKKAYGTNQD